MSAPSILDTTIPQREATLFIQNIQTTEKLKDNIRFSLYDIHLKQYLQDKYKWTPTTFNYIDWNSHHTLISKHKTPKDRIHILKGIHGWRPTKRRLHIINKQTKEDQREQICNKCPLCKKNEETQNHIYQCTKMNAHNFRIKTLQNLTRYCQRRNTHPAVTKVLITNLHHWMENIQYKKTTPSTL